MGMGWGMCGVCMRCVEGCVGMGWGVHEVCGGVCGYGVGGCVEGA